MKRIDVGFVQEGEKLLVMLDPSQITSFVHADEILLKILTGTSAPLDNGRPGPPPTG
jgi:hypothetical protein